LNPLISSYNGLKANRIDLWFIDPLQLTNFSDDYIKSILSPDEITKFASFKHKEAQQIFLITRLFTRLILSQYALCSPIHLQFSRNKHGKPELLDNPNNIRFNLSHNNHLIVMAVTINDDIGCDIESPERRISILPISKRYFAKQEHQALSLLTGEAQQQLFFKYWTLNEAFVKAVGVGISLGLDTFYFDINEVDDKQVIKLQFNDTYTLAKHNNWRFYQKTLNKQMLAICRESSIEQSINYIDAQSLFKDK